MKAELTKRREAALVHVLFFSATLFAANAVADTATTAVRADPMTLRVKRGFVDSVYGKIHNLTAHPETSLSGTRWKTPLVMFHSSPLSSQEFAPLIAELGWDRNVIAPNTPGQGLSDGPDRVFTIADWAAMHAALTQLNYGKARPVDFFANHTGAWIAGELTTRTGTGW